MSLRSQELPNKHLQGHEIRKCMVDDLDAMLAKDYVFSKGIAYKKCAYTISVTFHGGYPHQVHEVQVRTRKTDVIEGEAPLKEPDEDAALVALEREVVLDNPNLARVHHDLPVVLQERMPPPPVQPMPTLPGEPPQELLNYPEVKNTELRYQKEDYPPLPEPKDRDVTEQVAAKMGIQRGAKGLRK